MQYTFSGIFKSAKIKIKGGSRASLRQQENFKSNRMLMLLLRVAGRLSWVWLGNLVPPAEIFIMLCSLVHLFERSPRVKQEAS